MGKYDVARRCFREREAQLLTRVAKGSARGFAELDALRRGPLSFPATRFEGGIDYGRGASSHHLREPRPGAGLDFLLGVSNTGDDISGHPALQGMLPRAVSTRGAAPAASSARSMRRARPTTAADETPAGAHRTATPTIGSSRSPSQNLGSLPRALEQHAACSAHAPGVRHSPTAAAAERPAHALVSGVVARAAKPRRRQCSSASSRAREMASTGGGSHDQLQGQPRWRDDGAAAATSSRRRRDGGAPRSMAAAGGSSLAGLQRSVREHMLFSAERETSRGREGEGQSTSRRRGDPLREPRRSSAREVRQRPGRRVPLR